MCTLWRWLCSMLTGALVGQALIVTPGVSYMFISNESLQGSRALDADAGRVVDAMWTTGMPCWHHRIEAQ
jgi:hypothetical protein